MTQSGPRHEMVSSLSLTAACLSSLLKYLRYAVLASDKNLNKSLCRRSARVRTLSSSLMRLFSLDVVPSRPSVSNMSELVSAS
ncbi:hypothetical protein BpHYR1_040640 [Brachionus plicatilis]|uniref:Uncharacterized protein n=1 Tax=Brachionus plicatilis TaxID=10195 RepID=A0A3M7RYS8_BRAPC|nr:hypothetical protein BpHYR1_040640 [Brachionus plicatilis]